MNSPKDDYLLRTDPEELSRMELQHSLWRPVAIRLWDAAEIKEGMRVLDLGCGPGDATLDLAERIGPTGTVVAVDQSPQFLFHLQESIRERGWETRIEIKQSEFSQLELEADSFDAVWARWALCWDPDPTATLAQISRGLSLGGTLIVQDYLNFGELLLTPREPDFERVVEAFLYSWRNSGGSPNICSYLPQLMQDCGFTLEHDVPINKTTSPSEPMWQWPTTFYISFVPELVRLELLTEEEAADFHSAWARASKNPKTTFPLPEMRGLVARKS